ncbi:MAG TPA: histidine kinase dimerization/phospho-acceptor domain-containing protein, partial [Adhaeribacter sp.]|nr:histidine kinase dimerization/phospho-acceptor domain-containing protein [Adhaeribacter sp.]
MEDKQEKTFLQSIYGKVIAAFFIGVVAIGLAGLVSKVGFKEMLQTVESLSAPNDKLRIVNSLFYQVTRLEQLQHVNAIENPQESATDFEPEIQKVIASIDSLREFSRHDPAQLARLDTMAALLQEREELSESYFALRNDLEKNQALSTKINDLSVLLAKLQPKANKRVVTTSKKYITTTLVPPGRKKAAPAPEISAEKEENMEEGSAEKASFLSRLFGSDKKKVKAEKPIKIKKGTTEVKEEVHVKVDTYSVPQHVRSLAEVEQELRQIEKDYHERNAALLARELALVKASHKLNGQLLDILKTFEAEEMAQSQGDFSKATAVVQSSVYRMNIITVIFSLGAALFAFLIVVDIARGNKLRKALQRAKEEAEHLSQVKQRFLANMSHELRTPLQSILGFAEQVRGQAKPKPEALDAIFYSAEHLLQIVNEVLDYSRIVSGKFTFVQQPFDVQQLAREVVATLQPQVSKKDLKLSLRFSC